MTLQELVYAVEDWAANTANISIQDAETVIEDILPSAMQAVALKAASDPKTESLLRRNFTVTLASGTGTVDPLILTSCWKGASVYVTAEPTIGPLMSYVPNWNDFMSPMDTRLGYWTFQSDDTIYWIDPGETFDITSGRSGDIVMNIASVPAVPTTQTATLDMPDELTSNLTAYLVDVLRQRSNPTKDA
jgi:hypothetical protein